MWGAQVYIPGPFAVDEDEAAAMLAAARFGLLVTHDERGLHATHMPFVFDQERRVLMGHVAGRNPQPAGEGPAMAVFGGPHAYVSPNWYPTKARDGRAVPTWNYEAVHVHGRVTWQADEAWKRAHLAQLSARFEADEARPWTLAEAPADYIEKLLRGLTGVELAIERIEAKRKLSQNQPEENRLGVIEGLTATGEAGALAVAGVMSALTRA